MVDQPLVSVILPVYNAEKHVAEAVQSILDQTYKNFELILIDDCSTDKSFETLQSFKDPRIKLHRNEKNQKLIYTLNKAIQLSSGEYIARMDADDISLPTRLQQQVEYLQKFKDVAVLGSQIQFIDENGVKKGKPLICVTDSARIKWRFHFGNCMNHPTVMFRKSIVDRSDFYDPEYVHAEDYELWLRLSRKYAFDNLPQVLLKYRVHSGSVSYQHSEKQVESTCRALAVHLKQLYKREYSLDVLKAVVFPRLKNQVSGVEIAPYFKAFYPENIDAKGLYLYLRFKELFFRYFKV